MDTGVRTAGISMLLLADQNPADAPFPLSNDSEGTSWDCYRPGCHPVAVSWPRPSADKLASPLAAVPISKLEELSEPEVFQQWKAAER